MAGKLSRIVAILKSAPRQIVSAYRKGRREATLPGAGAVDDRRLRKRRAVHAGDNRVSVLYLFIRWGSSSPITPQRIGLGVKQ